MYKIRLLELGIPPELKGFSYTNYALQAYNPPQNIMDLYDDVAGYFGTTPIRAERAIRHAITKTGIKITNGAFIAKYKILWSKE